MTKEEMRDLPVGGVIRYHNSGTLFRFILIHRTLHQFYFLAYGVGAYKANVEWVDIPTMVRYSKQYRRIA